VAGTVSTPYGTVSKSDHDHNLDAAEYLGVSQITLFSRAQRNLFPSGDSRTVLSANTTYRFEGNLYLTISGAPYPAGAYLDFDSSSSSYSLIVGSFINYSRVESTAITYSGHFTTDTSPTDSFSIIQTTSGSDRYPCVKVKGFYITGSEDITVEPKISSTYLTPTIQGQTYFAFYDVGSSSVTTINGTWS
jgi:hypothetical protein